MIDALVSIADRLIQLKTYRDTRLKELHASLLEPLFDDLLLIHNDYMQLFDRTEQMLPSLDAAVPRLFKLSSRHELYFEDATAAKRLLPDAQGYPALANCEACFLVPAADGGNPIWVGFEYMVNAGFYADVLGVAAQDVRVAERARTPPPIIDELRNARDSVREARQAFEPARVKLRALAAQAESLELSPEARVFVHAVTNYFPDGTFDTRRTSSAATSVLVAFDEHWSRITDAYTAHTAVSSVSFLLSDLRYDARLKWAHVCEAYAALKIAIVGRS
jgi:hypothetical protein